MLLSVEISVDFLRGEKNRGDPVGRPYPAGANAVEGVESTRRLLFATKRYPHTANFSAAVRKLIMV